LRQVTGARKLGKVQQAGATGCQQV
jgi:hypothetical protein